MIIRHYILMRYLGLILLLFVCGTVEAAERSESITGQVLDMGWDTMKEFGGVFGKTVFHLIMWSLLGLVWGGIGGWFLWKTLRDRGWMEVSWGWYRYVRWIWPVLIVLTVSLSLASSAGTWGSGWAFKKSVREGQVIETVVFKTYAMVMVWRLGPQGEDANGSAFLERDLGAALEKLKQTTAQTEELEAQSRETALAEMEERMGEGRIHKWFYRKMIEYLWDEQVKSELTGSEMGEFLEATLSADAKDGEVAAVQYIRSQIMKGVYRMVDETVNSLVYPTVFTIILTALSVLGFPLGTFWLARWWWLKKHPETPTDSEDPPELNSAAAASE